MDSSFILIVPNPQAKENVKGDVGSKTI